MAASNLRAANYSIPPADRHKVYTVGEYSMKGGRSKEQERERVREEEREKEGERERERDGGGK